MLLQEFSLAEEQLTRNMQGWAHPERCLSARRVRDFSRGGGGVRERRQGWSFPPAVGAGRGRGATPKSPGGKSFSRNESTAKGHLRAWHLFPLRNLLGGFSSRSAPRADISPRFKSL